MFVSSTYRITGLHFIDECATFCAANADYLYQENHLVTLQLWVTTLSRAYAAYLYFLKDWVTPQK